MWKDLGENGVVILRWKSVQCTHFVLRRHEGALTAVMLGIIAGAKTLIASVTNFFTMKLDSRAPFIDYSGETMMTTRSKLRFGI